MTYTPAPLEGLLILEPKVFGDARGYFLESFSASSAAAAGLPTNWIQDNESLSRRGTWRGLHLQAPPHGQSKLVRVVRGAVLDVAVDVRRASPTYGQHFAIELSAENHRQLWVPEGFAHGFLTLTDDTLFLYKVAGSGYAPDAERGLRYNDPALGLTLPFEPTFLSEKDLLLPLLADFDSPY